MGKIVIQGGKPLFGEVLISGSKNTSLTLLPSVILYKQNVSFINIPNIDDSNLMIHLLISIGCDVAFETNKSYINGKPNLKKKIRFNSSNVKSDYKLNQEIIAKMRASILIAGPLVSRFGYCKIYQPGGCVIGKRPIDIHLMAFREMGLDVEDNGDYTIIKGKIKNSTIKMPISSVGATANVIFSAVCSDAKVSIENCSIDKDVIELISLLNKSGGNIKINKDQRIIEINGIGQPLNDISYLIEPDRVEAMTYAMMAGITDGELNLNNCSLNEFVECKKEFEMCGISLIERENSVLVKRKDKNIHGCEISTALYPGFLTDVQAPMSALLSIADSPSIINENVFENRFHHMKYLNSMGANIEIKSERQAAIDPVKKLFGSNVFADDIRGGAGLILAGLIADGETVVSNVHYIERGYESIVNKINMCGGNLKKIG